MKKVILTVGMFIAMAGVSYAQAPEEFNYQAVARDVSGNVLPNQTVGVEISILENSSSGTIIYTETHAPTTNNFGLLNLNIGRGTIVSGTFNTIDWANNNYFVQISMDMTGGTNYNLMGTSQLISVPYALHAKTANSVANDMVDDADADPTNELQNLSISNDTIYISNGNHAILPSAVDTDEQTLSLSNDSLYISNGNGISLSDYAIDMVDDADNDPTNEIETWSTLSGIPADLADGVDNVDDADADPTNELQDISLSGTNLSITSGSTVDLSTLQDGVNDADADATNELQDISLSGTNLSISSGSTVDLSGLQDGVNDADANPTNEIQDISLSGTNLSISSGSTVDLSALQDGVNDADANPTNEIQDISLSGTNLSISSGSTVDLSGLQDGVNDADANPTNEIQDISLSGTNLSISSGSTVDLSALQDGVNDADASPTNEIQTLSLSGSNLSISGGNSVTLPSGGGGPWTTVSTEYHEIAFTGDDAEIKGNTSTDLGNSDFSLGTGVFWGTQPGEDTGMFTDGDQLLLISPGDNQLVQFWEEDGHQLVAQISGAGAYSQVSDENLKQNIEKIDNALEKTLKLSGYTYEYKQNEEDIRKGSPIELGMGILAQELKEVAPRLVTKTHQGHYVVNYDGIVPILIEATKDQQELIDNQQEEIDALKAELEAIKTLLKK